MPVSPAVVARIAQQPGLRLLVLHGSRARGDTHARSDWDFAYMATRGFDVDGLLAVLVESLGADRVDLADLDHAGALLRHRVATHGRALYEEAPGTFQTFQIEAARVWCDLVPVLQPAYARVLDALPQ